MTTSRYSLRALPVPGMISGKMRPATSSAEITDSTSSTLPVDRFRSFSQRLIDSKTLIIVPEFEDPDHVRSPSGRGELSWR